MTRIDSMKYILTVLLFILSVPAIAQESTTASKTDTTVKKAPVVNGSDLPVNFKKYYRYTNKKCDFSFQVPESPSTRIIWGEMKLPIDMPNTPPFGELGEHVKYHIRSIDGQNFFDLDAYCIYTPSADYKKVDLAFMERELQKVVNQNDLRNYKIRTQPVTDDFIVGSLRGLKTTENDQVHTYYYQYFKGLNSVLLLQMRYNAEYSGMDRMYKYIEDSLIYGNNN